jgi:2-dehydro-3-deoxyphosphooctonate aldolase (KDO 8-P synthase)
MKINNFTVDNSAPFFLIAGPCVIESEALVMHVAETMINICEKLQINYIFKASFDKANRSSHQSFRGPGATKGLEILAKVKQTFNIPIITDVHEDTNIQEVADVVDVLQTPAFLCRQTNFMQRVFQTGLPVNVKKGQFMAPEDMQQVVAKAHAVGNQKIMLCERGYSFGYHNLVSDMRSIAIMRKTGCPVVFDATHSVQLPGGNGTSTGGQREFIPLLARAAIAAGVAGVFMETHPNPDAALSDGPNAWPLDKMESLLIILKSLDQVIKNNLPLPEDNLHMATKQQGEIA